MHKKRPLPSGSSDPSGQTGHLSPKGKPPLAAQNAECCKPAFQRLFQMLENSLS